MNKKHTHTKANITQQVARTLFNGKYLQYQAERCRSGKRLLRVYFVDLSFFRLVERKSLPNE